MCRQDRCTYSNNIIAEIGIVIHEQLIKTLWNLELVHHPTFFDMMIHILIHLYEQSTLGVHVYMR